MIVMVCGSLNSQVGEVRSAKELFGRRRACCWPQLRGAEPSPVSFIRQETVQQGEPHPKRQAARLHLFASATLQTAGRAAFAGALLQEVGITAFAGAAGDKLGTAVAASGDTVVVGAPAANSGQGAVYVFTLSGAGYIQDVELTAADGAAGDAFGTSVSISSVWLNDYPVDTVAVGCARGGRGTAYVFTEPADDWASWTNADDPPGEVIAPNAQAGDAFGTSVSIASVATSDNPYVVATVAVGAPGAASGQGAAYVFTVSPSFAFNFSWTPNNFTDPPRSPAGTPTSPRPAARRATLSALRFPSAAARSWSEPPASTAVRGRPTCSRSRATPGRP